MRLRIYFIIMVVFISGCMNRPVPFSEAKLIPNERVFNFKNSGDSNLLVTRDKGFQGAGCNTRFYINGVLAAEFSHGEKYSFKVPSGKILLGIKPSAACGGGLHVEREVESAPGETIRRRIFVSSTHIDIMPTSIF